MEKANTGGAADADLGTKPASSPPAVDPWIAVYGLPCELSVALGVAGFKVRDLLALDHGVIVESQSNATGLVGVWVNGVEIAKAEFDVLRS
ncbi:MAG: FliM/FliN family flagellar motor switch protein, partial [Acidobacteriota bacterium]|nr:FliM/FliN family flagellar motor switch protein [Acidobacteriota bacterium]